MAERYTLSGDSVYCYRFDIMPGQSERIYNFFSHNEMHQAFTSTLPCNQLKVSRVEVNRMPDDQYSEGFPQVLTDSRRGVAGFWRQGWAGWSAPDTVELTLTLEKSSSIDEITVGTSHSPGDWVVKPLDIQVSLSLDGKKWSKWESMELPNPPADLNSDSRRLLYLLEPCKAKKVGFVRLRFICRPTLPIWHPYFGQKSWLMLDEIELKHANY